MKRKYVSGVTLYFLTPPAPYYYKKGAITIHNQAEAIPLRLSDKLKRLRYLAGETEDLNIRNFVLNGVAMSSVVYDGLVSKELMARMIMAPLLKEPFAPTDGAKEIHHFIHAGTVMATDLYDVTDYDKLFRFLSSGFLALFIDGIPEVVVIGAQGFFFRSVSEPTNETNEKASKEGFVEPVRVNMSIIRRRIKTPTLKFEILTAGSISQTDICLVYLHDSVSPSLLRKVKAQIKKLDIDMVLTSGYLTPFLQSERASLFSDVGTTERPDTMCAKIKEGRIGILIDGTPFALIVPYLFSENFQSMDDYANRPYYACLIRLLKYVCMMLSIALPGLYVALGTFHPELFPQALLFNIAAAQEVTPFSLMVEALVIHFIYEIMREAGLRLPKSVGHTVGIIGSLVIGDAAVSAGLIGAPMVLVLTLTAISSYVVPSLHEPISVLRFVYILVGGTFGLFGLSLVSAMVLVNLCALSAFGVPYTAPIAPLTLRAMRDTFVRVGIPTMQRHNAKIRDLTGVHLEKEDDQ